MVDWLKLAKCNESNIRRKNHILGKIPLNANKTKYGNIFETQSDAIKQGFYFKQDDIHTDIYFPKQKEYCKCGHIMEYGRVNKLELFYCKSCGSYKEFEHRSQKIVSYK